MAVAIPVTAVLASVVQFAPRKTSASAGPEMVGAAGAVVSSMVNVAEQVLSLPQSSVAVKVTVALPVSAQRSLRAVKSCVIVTSLSQLSVADAPARKAVNSAMLPAPSHSTVMSDGHVIIGATSSRTRIVWSQLTEELVLPQLSVAEAVQVRTKL